MTESRAVAAWGWDHDERGGEGATQERFLQGCSVGLPLPTPVNTHQITDLNCVNINTTIYSVSRQPNQGGYD